VSHFQATVIADSISPANIRLPSIEMVFPRIILPEFNTHRQLSRSFSSSRAIPTRKLLEMVERDPVRPIHWGKNQPGMQANEELDELGVYRARQIWDHAAYYATLQAKALLDLGVHKQVVNRILEPFLPVRGIATATEWANFFGLRRHRDAQPEIRYLADLMWEALERSTPRLLQPGEWHLPYVLEEELERFGGLTDPTGTLRKISAARCARSSYRTHDGRVSTLEEDLGLCDRLIKAELIHASPFEHQATPDVLLDVEARNGRESFGFFKTFRRPGLHGNLNGWVQARKLLPNECIKETV